MQSGRHYAWETCGPLDVSLQEKQAEFKTGSSGNNEINPADL
jgi:hypothetical protein